MYKKCRVIVIGAGASGVVAAIAAAKKGADVIILERNSCLGKKINATGNGRCNFTNVDALNSTHYIGGNDYFIKNVLSVIKLDNIIDFFDSIGVTPILEENGKYFPLSGQASSVSELLEREALNAGINIIYNEKVNKIKSSECGIDVATDNKTFYADKIIIATGGMAAPDTGSDGIGYELAKSQGHTIKRLMPAIVQIKTKDGFYKRMSGLRINAMASLFIEGQLFRTESGDVMFFDYGLSGPPIFQLSTFVSYAISEGKSVYVELDVVPSYSDEELKDYLIKRCKNCNYSIELMLVGFINKKLIQWVLDYAKLDMKVTASHFNNDDIVSLVNSLKHHKVEVSGTKGWENAQATAGGINLYEVDNATLKSKINPKISFCGEILDVVGECGGYNLTWAWISGFVAGSNCL